MVYTICKLLPDGQPADDNGEVLAYDFATPDGAQLSTEGLQPGVYVVTAVTATEIGRAHV